MSISENAGKKKLTEVNETAISGQNFINDKQWIGNSLEIQANGTQNELVRRQTIEDHVSVKNDITAEQQAASNGIN
jgi:hypothetical protein